MTLHRSSAIPPGARRTGRLASVLISFVAIAIALGSSTAALTSDDQLATHDADGDGLPDLVEIQLTRTNPFHPDSDRDGVNDGDEILIHRSDPLNADTDGDGVIDGDEVRMGTDPLQDEQAADELAGLRTAPERPRASAIGSTGHTGRQGRLPTISISAPENRLLREVEVRPDSPASRFPLTPIPHGFD